MKTNEVLQKEVQNALKWEPTLKAAEIGVIVDDGIVTLTGSVDNYNKKLEAEDAAKNVAGVKAIVENIKVILPHAETRTDYEVAKNIVDDLAKNLLVPAKKLKIKVENGLAYLEGNLAWDFQREAAKESVSAIRGVKGIIDNIEIQSEIHDRMEEDLVKAALKRNPEISSDDINVNVSGTKVILTGYVASIFEKDEAGRIAWKTPGVWSVDNRLIIEHDYQFAG